MVSALLGAIVALVGFGPGYLFGTSPFWTYPPTDFSSHLVGWREYVQEPWTFPLLLSRKLEQPDGLNILYMDALPLVALAVKAVRALIPDSLRTLFLNPFGWWQLVSFALQGTFAAKLARSLGAGFGAQVSCAAVALTMEAFIARFHHTGLSSHFIILAALWLYVRASEPTPDMSSRIRATGRWVALFVVAILIHPYLFVMVAGIFAATLVRWLSDRRFRSALEAGVFSVAAVTATMAVSGYFGSRLSRGSDWGFGHKSTDLLSFVVPQHSPFFPWRTSMSIDLAHAEGAEGYDYLGVGVIALALILSFTARSAMVRTIRKNKALAIVLFAMTLFAISNRVSVGGHVVLELPVPKAIMWFVGQLRASGRFIWPPTYAAALYLVVLAYERFPVGRLALVPPSLVLLQFVDGMGNFAFVRSVTAQPERSWLDWSAIDPIVKSHEGVSIRPSYSCVELGHGETVMRHMELQTMAAIHSVGLSGVRSSRDLVDCAKENETLRGNEIDRNRLYVFFEPEIPEASAVHFERLGLACGSFGPPSLRGFMCSRQFAVMPRGLSAYPAVDYGMGTALKIGVPEASVHLGRGWSSGEGTHRWTVGPRATLYLRTSEPVAADSLLRIRGGTAVFPNRPRTTASIRVNGIPAGTFVLTNDEAHDLDVPMPAEAVGERRIEVQLDVDEYRSPKELGVNEDARKLGIFVVDAAILSRR